MSALARPLFPAPLAAPVAAVLGALRHLRDSWRLAMKLRAEAQRRYPYLEF